MPDTSRIVAVEEHVAFEEYWRRTEALPVFDGEQDELAFTRSFLADDTMRQRLVDVDTRLAEMDAAGVDLSVLSLNPPGVQAWADAGEATALASETNDALADLVTAHPTRFAGLAAVAPQDPEAAAAEIARAVDTLGFAGVLISSHTAGHYLDEPRFEPILSALESTGLPLYLHPRMPSPAMLGPMRPYGLQQALWGFQAEAGTHAMRLIMSGTLDRHPGLRIVLGHLGEGLPYWLWRTDNIHAKFLSWAKDLLGMASLDLTPSEYFLRNFLVTTSGMCDPDVLGYCLAKLGAERVLFAVDYPYEDSTVATRFLRDAPLTRDQRALIGHANAERLFLGLDPSSSRAAPRRSK